MAGAATFLLGEGAGGGASGGNGGHWLRADGQGWAGAAQQVLVWALLIAQVALALPAVSCATVAAAGAERAGRAALLGAEEGCGDVVRALAQRVGAETLALEGSAGLAAGALRGVESFVRGAAGLGAWLLVPRPVQMRPAALGTVAALALALRNPLRGGGLSVSGGGRGGRRR